MIILDATTKTIKVNMTGAITTTNPGFTVAYADDTASGLTEGANNGSLNGVTDVTVVAAPAASTRRVIKFISIQNTDTTAKTINIKYDVSATQVNIAVVTLQVNEVWTTDGTYDSGGALKNTMGVVSLTSGVTGVLPVANGGTNASSASITAFNNITGYTASGSTGTTSTNLVFSTSPTLITPALGTPSALVLTNASGTVTNLTLVTPALGTPSSGTLTSCTGLPIAGLVASTSTVLGVGSIELGHATDTTIARVSAGVISVEGVTVDTISATNTLTNKRITPRVSSASSYTTDTGSSLNSDNYDWFIVTAQAGALKFNNPGGTPTDGQALKIAVTGTAARALTWDTAYSASTVALPTTTVTTARLNIGFVWSAAGSTWICVAAA
jgi:hypothetical protein